MILSDSRGFQVINFEPNEILLAEDARDIGFAQYKNITSTMATITRGFGASEDALVVSGLLPGTPSAMSVPISSGAAVGFTGEYISDTNSWGFSSDAGRVFSVVLPSEVSVTFGVGHATHPRVDIVQIRPIMVSYNDASRDFKDPISGVVNPDIISTRTEFTCELSVAAGTPSATPSAPATTAGWIKLWEVLVPVDATSISAGNIITYVNSVWWTVAASSTAAMHNATRDAVASTLMFRDVGGRARVQDPSNNLDIANRQYVDGLINTTVLLTGDQTIGGVKTFEDGAIGLILDVYTDEDPVDPNEGKLWIRRDTE